MSQLPRRHCSVPDVFGFREWFVKNFDDICYEHDMHYVNKDVCMIEADAKAIYKIAKRRPDTALPLLALLVTGLPIIYPLALWRWYT